MSDIAHIADFVISSNATSAVKCGWLCIVDLHSIT